jgi:hypothetical protein
MLNGAVICWPAGQQSHQLGGGVGERVDGAAIQQLIRETLAGYRYEPPPPGSSIGVPWSADKVNAYAERLRGCLVEPYQQRFELRETYPQCVAEKPAFADYWVVAESAGYLEWFDPSAGEFGLGQRVEGRAVPVSIGVRGDLVGVFCAM